MKPLIDYIESHPTTYGAFAALLSLFFPQVRRLLAATWRKIGARGHKLDLILTKVTNIETEIQFSNDTSTKQEVALLKKRFHLDFWRATKPSIEMDGDAQVLHVSETLCKLMGVWTPADLHMRNWLRCVEAGRVDEFLTAFVESVKYKSDFDFVFSVQTKAGALQGQWKLIMADVTPSGYSKTIYSGFFKPMDDRAKEVAQDLHWSK